MIITKTCFFSFSIILGISVVKKRLSQRRKGKISIKQRYCKKRDVNSRADKTIYFSYNKRLRTKWVSWTPALFKEVPVVTLSHLAKPIPELVGSSSSVTRNCHSCSAPRRVTPKGSRKKCFSTNGPAIKRDGGRWKAGPLKKKKLFVNFFKTESSDGH